MEQRYSRDEIIDALFAITDQDDYNVWIGVGMVLKENGFDVGIFDDWSRQFTKYVPGCCQEKWDKLDDEPRSTGPIKSIGSIIYEAKKNGWRKRGEPLAWDSPIGGKFVSPKKLALPRYPGSPAEQLKAYLRSVFQDSDIVGYVNESKWNDKQEKMVPANSGVYDRTAGDIIANLPPKGDINWAIGDTDPEGGAWIRLNPLDGQGVEDKNVVAYRYALVESDEGTPEEQYAIIKALKLPTAAVVYSGKKSVHAVVHIDAPNRDIFRSRVDTLFEVCRYNGLVVDEKNKNPSRLSRMPGVKRGDQDQYLVEVGGETASWFEWLEVVKRLNRAKEIKRMGDYREELEAFEDEPVVDGIISRGEAAMLSSGSKVGKTWAMMGLALATLSGTPFLGMKCFEGKILYIDNELREPMICDRLESLCINHDRLFGDKWEPLIDEYSYISNRQRLSNVDDVIDDIDLACELHDISLVIVDPLRAVLQGDESDVKIAQEVSHRFMACAARNNVALIVVHHYSKGDQSGKAAIDRFSGSGAWASSFDTVISITGLEKDERVLGYIDSHLNQLWPGWENVTRNDRKKAIAEIMPARMEFSIRHHGPHAPVNFFWRPCCHVPDVDDVLSESKIAGSDPNAKKTEQRNAKIQLLEEAIIKADEMGETPVNPDVFLQGDYALATSAETIRKYVEKSDILQYVKVEGQRKRYIDLIRSETF